MQEFKGTPAPWRAEDNPGGGTAVYGDHGSQKVCVMSAGTSLIDADNALLIAAAPELLEALRIARDYVAADLEHRKQAFAGYPQKWETEERDLAAIDAAIAKALNTDTTER